MSKPKDDGPGATSQSARLTAAQDLVNRTLAQHGLTSESGGPGPTLNMPAMPDLEALKSQFAGMTGLSGLTGSAGVPVPQGARFETAEYTCAAGRRSYRLYVPSSATARPTGVVLMLHGCMQSPEDFARGTGLNALAEERGFLVIYPAQDRGSNAQTCWNWFSRADQQRDQGEPAILAGLTRSVMASYDVPPARAFVAGLSAGGAMAVVLGETHPDLFAAIGVHSGLAYAVAQDVPSAMAAMSGQPGVPVSQGRVKTSIPTILFQGDQDFTVAPINADLIIEDALAVASGPITDTAETDALNGRHYHRRVVLGANGSCVLDVWRIAGLGHAWSGGQPIGSYTDPSGPDASAEMVRFFFDRVTGGLA